MPSAQATQSQPDPTADVQFDEAGMPAGEQLSLLEMTRIMDVAATLRKERSLVEQQLNIDELKAQLRERLLDAAKASGDPVTAGEVDAAIEQYYDRLHEFQSPKASWRTFLAHLWVRRGPILAGLIAVAGVIATCWGLIVSGILPGKARDERIAVQQSEALDETFQSFEQLAAGLEQIADDPRAQTEINSLRAAASAAFAARDRGKLDETIAAASQIQSQLEASYRLEVLSGADEQSGIEREFTDDNGTRTSGYYVIVEARDSAGRPVTTSVRNRETGQLVRTSRWAEQVPEVVFNRLAADKQADGVLDERLFGEKHRGRLELDVDLKGADGQPLSRTGQITSWQ